MNFLIHLSIFNINYEYSKMSFLSTFTCHFGHHIPSNSNNECSLGSGKVREITSLHKKRQQKIKKKISAVFGKTEKKDFFFFLLFLEKRWRKILIFFCCFGEKTVEKKNLNFFFCRSHLHHRIYVHLTFLYIFGTKLSRDSEKCHIFDEQMSRLSRLEKRWGLHLVTPPPSHWDPRSPQSDKMLTNR